MLQPPEARQTTRLIVILGLGALASALASRALDPLVGEIAAEFQQSPATVALLNSAFALPYALIQLVLGPVGDSIGKRRVIRACLALLVATLVASAFVPGFWSLLALRVLAGAAAGGVFPLAIAIIGDKVPIERRQVALSRLLVAGLTGAVGGGILAALVAPWAGWRGVVLACATASVVAVLAMRDRDPTPPTRLPALGEVLARYRALLSLAAARRLYVAVFIEGTLCFGIFPFLAPLLIERGQGGAAQAGIAIAGFALGGFAFAAAAPLMLARLGQARMVMAGGAVSATSLSLLALVPTVEATVAAFLLLGLGFYMVHSSIQTRVTELAPHARGGAVSLHAFSFFMGQALGPVVMGAGRATIGTEASLLLAAAGILALGLWLGPRGAPR